MDQSKEPSKPYYESLYQEFESPLMRELRRDAYGEDIGQHSWVTASDLRRDAVRLGISADGLLLDLGCGPCGPLNISGQRELSSRAVRIVQRGNSLEPGTDGRGILESILAVHAVSDRNGYAALILHGLEGFLIGEIIADEHGLPARKRRLLHECLDG